MVTTVVAAITGIDQEYTENYVHTIEKLAPNKDIEVVLTHVYAEEDREKMEDMFDVNLEQPQHVDMVAEHNSAVQQFAERLDDRDISHRTRGSIGDPATEILDIADDEEADFILVAGRKRSPAGKAIFGSTSQHVLLNSSRPVIFIGLDEDIEQP
jgi:nucleotide-binding universal stress UspA family protein